MLKNKKFRSALTIGIIAVLVVVFYLINNRDESIENTTPAALFSFKENLAVEWNTVAPIEIEVMDKVEKLELIYNDSVFKSWTKPQGKINYDFNAGYFGLGARTLTLKSYKPDGSTYEDNRLVRVLSDVEPEKWRFEIVERLPHNIKSYTQGLEFSDGQLYEGTGQYNQSLVAKVNLKNGEHSVHTSLDGSKFGEGITIVGDLLYQITWKAQRCFVYDKNTLQLQAKEFSYTGEGWGLCNDGKRFIMSNGTERLTFRSLDDFTSIGTVDVYDQFGPVTKLNELEYIDGLIYANVYMSNKVMVIQPETGKVIAEIDATQLVLQGRGMNGDVLNGIAYDANNSKLYLTGKYWHSLFEVRIDKGEALL